MGPLARRRRSVAVALALLLAATACETGPDRRAEPSGDPASPEEPTGPGEEPPRQPPAGEGVPGVADEPCPDAVDEAHGCIHLGALTTPDEELDAAATDRALDGRRAFWRQVNATGGVGGYEVAVDTHVRRVGADPDDQVRAYEELRPHVLALALTPGIATTEDLLTAMDDDDVLGAAASWWSGWHAPEEHRGVMLASGPSHCLGAALALDWFAETVDRPISVLAVGHPGRYGGDVAAGARAWAAATETGWGGTAELVPGGDPEAHDEVVQTLLASGAEVVLLGLGPEDTGEVVRKAAARGFEGMFLGAAPSWDAALLDDRGRAQPLRALYRHVGPWEPARRSTAAHEAVADVLDDDEVADVAFVAGWLAQYPLLAALRAVVADDGEVSREALRAVVDGLEVDYDGVVPSRPLFASAVDRAQRAHVSVPEPDDDLGLRGRFEVGPGPVTAELELQVPCGGDPGAAGDPVPGHGDRVPNGGSSDDAGDDEPTLARPRSWEPRRP